MSRTNASLWWCTALALLLWNRLQQGVRGTATRTLWRCKRLWQWMRGRRHEWGVMHRVGTWSS